MSIETTAISTLAIIFLMSVVTLSTRWGGVFVMGYLPFGRKLKQFITAMSGSVLVALLTPMAVEGDLAAKLALLTTAMVMLITKKPLLAMILGVASAAGFRHL